MDVPEFTLKEVYLVLKGFRAACGRHSQFKVAFATREGIY